MEPRTKTQTEALTQAVATATLDVPTGWLASLVVAGTFGAGAVTGKIVGSWGECPIKNPLTGDAWSITAADSLSLGVFPGAQIVITVAGADGDTDLKASVVSRSF